MSLYSFPVLRLEDWIGTRNTLQGISKLLSNIKCKYTPHDKNWEEFALGIYAKGLSTQTIPAVAGIGIDTLDLNLNLYEDKLKMFVGETRISIPIENQSPFSFAEEAVIILNALGVEYEFDSEMFSNNERSDYDKVKVLEFWSALKQIYFIMLKFKAGLLEETSSINFWPHHFDLSMLWFSGRLIPDKDPEDWDNSREQMNFGFSTGDDAINEPYFYITAYPFNEGLLQAELPGKSYWHTKGWNGAVLLYNEITTADNPEELIISFFRDVLNTNKKLIGI